VQHPARKTLAMLQRGLPQQERPMTEREFESKLAELDRLLNDPEIRMDPHRVWALLAELSSKARMPSGPAMGTAAA
jgi:hypothetical protein